MSYTPSNYFELIQMGLWESMEKEIYRKGIMQMCRERDKDKKLCSLKIKGRYLERLCSSLRD
jgi:hypothetical protein